jgi:thiol:disulfide interchange protein
MQRFLVTLLFVYSAFAQRLDPVSWSLKLDQAAAAPGSRVPARLAARIDPGWHLYSLSTPPGPIPTTLKLQDNPATGGFQVYQPKPTVALDPNFKVNTETFENEVVFLLVIELKSDAPAGPVDLEAQIRYQACDARQCLLPTRKKAVAHLRVDPSAAGATVSIPSGYSLFESGGSGPAAPVSGGDPNVGRAGAGPAPAPAPSKRSEDQAQSLGMFVMVAFGFGLAAIFTPCVFPMIPITVSFFLNRQSGSRSQSVFQALVFSIGIIVLFSSLGLATTAILGPFGAVQLGSSPWVNAFISLVFLAFGLSLLGAFEMAIPSSVLTRVNRASERGGTLGTLLMGLTFSLTSFACVGPFVGTLLAGSVSGGGLRPPAGMAAFASGLALPFFLLALFPSYLKKLPRSGNWMVRIKIVLGFVVLAAMLKYLSNVDAVLGFNILTRERFLAAWMVLFALPGLYLLGFLRLEGVGSNETVGVSRLLAGAAFLGFAISLVPGLLGGKLGEIDAYVPLASQAGAAAGSQGSSPWMKNKYKDALARGRAEGKAIFLSFTGYACTNCHWMKSNMFPRPEIAEALGNYVPVELYTDGTDADSELNRQILTEKFATVAIPFYALIDSEGKVLSSFAGLTRDPNEFLAFLRSNVKM